MKFSEVICYVLIALLALSTINTTVGVEYTGDEIAEAFGLMQNDIGNIANNMTTVKGDVSTIKTDISGLITRADNIEQRLNNGEFVSQAEVANLKQDISKASGNTSNLELWVYNLDTQVQTTMNTTSNLEGQVSGLSGNIQMVMNTTETLQGQMSAFEERYSNLVPGDTMEKSELESHGQLVPTTVQGPQGNEYALEFIHPVRCMYFQPLAQNGNILVRIL